MRFPKEHKKIPIVLFTLTLLLSTTVLATEPEPDFSQPDITAVTTPPPQEPTQTIQPLKSEDTQASPEMTPVPESVSTPVEPARDEENGSPTPMTDEPSTPAITEDPVDEGPPEETKDPADEEPAGTTTPEEQPSVTIAIKWDIPTEDGLLRAGDPITLIAEITTEAEGIGLQWQAAAKAPKDLAEDEPEWADIAGANGHKHAFIMRDGMQSWRWRLRVSMPHGGTVFSDEISLPRITDEGLAPVLAEEDEAGLDASETPLPTATVTLKSGIPLDELAFSDPVTLVAEIHFPRDDMLLQWQYTFADDDRAEEDWRNIDGATGSTHTFIIDEENTKWVWRLLITVPEEVLPEDAEGQMPEE